MANDTDTGPAGGGNAHPNRQPGLGINHIIALQGVFPSGTAGAFGEGGDAGVSLANEPFIGEIRLFAGTFAPRGWALCDGSILGAPDLRGRSILHPGLGPGLTPRQLGQKVGVEHVTLSVSQMPAHAHTIPPVPPDNETFPTGGGGAHTNMQPSLGINAIIALTGLYPSQSIMAGDPGPVPQAGTDPFIGEIGFFAGNFVPRGWAFLDGQLLSIQQNTALFSLLGTTYGGDGQTTFALPDMRGRLAMHAGRGPGLSDRRLGQKIGVESVTLSNAQIPTHQHSLHWPSPNDATLPTGGGAAHTNMQPSLTLNYIIALQGVSPSSTIAPGSDELSATDDAPVVTLGADPMLGEITLFGGTFAPRGWAFCDGQLLPIQQYSALFSILGTTYGGDGRVTFGLPDLRGRVPIHPGTGPGLSAIARGQVVGSENVTLDMGQLPVHLHEIPEPTGLSLLALGGLAVLRRRRRQAAHRTAERD